MKKKKLNSKNPKYWKEDKKEEPIIKERRLITSTPKIKAYATFIDG